MYRGPSSRWGLRYLPNLWMNERVVVERGWPRANGCLFWAGGGRTRSSSYNPRLRRRWSVPSALTRLIRNVSWNFVNFIFTHTTPVRWHFVNGFFSLMLKFKLSVVALSTMCGDFIFWLTRLSLTCGSMMFCLVTCNKIFLYDTAVQYLVPT